MAWHLEQVLAMASRAMVERLSSAGRMWWAVWHDTQLGAAIRPFLKSASPWMLSV